MYPLKAMAATATTAPLSHNRRAPPGVASGAPERVSGSSRRNHAVDAATVAAAGGRVRGFYHIKDPLEPGIVIGKSAAMNWGGRWMVRVLTDEGFDLSKVLITDLDSDYRVHPQYFAWISWHHAREALRDYVIWQPVPLFHNNIWQVPLAVRIMSASTSQWQMFLHSRP